MAKTRAQQNKAIRQDALREQLAEQCRVQHILENINKLEALDNELDSIQVQRIDKANNQRLKLLNKYLPDLQSTQLTGDSEAPLIISRIERTIVDPSNTDS